jgi:hypothetical protein
MKFEKYLAKLHLDSVTIGKVMELVKVIIAQPGGIFLVGWLTIDMLERIGYFGTVTPATPNQIAAGQKANDFISMLSKALPPGLSQAFQLGGAFGANVGTGNTGAVDAAFLKTGLFSICMVQALGGGQGIATLGTAALAALK